MARTTALFTPSSIDLLLEDYLSRVLGADDLTILAAVLIALHLDLVGTLDLLSERIGLLFVCLERGQARILSEDQHVPRTTIVHRPKDLVRLLEPCLDRRILTLLELAIQVLHVHLVHAGRDADHGDGPDRAIRVILVHLGCDCPAHGCGQDSGQQDFLQHFIVLSCFPVTNAPGLGHTWSLPDRTG